MSPGWSLPTLIRTAQGGGQGLALRGEGSPGPGKYLGPQRTDVWVIEKRTVIEQAIIFIVSSHTQEAFTTAGGVKGLGAAVCDVSASKQKLGTFPAVNHGGAPTSLCRGIGDLKVENDGFVLHWGSALKQPLSLQICWLQSSFGRMERGFFIFEGSHVEECLMAKTHASLSSPPSDPHSALPYLIPLSCPRFPLVSPPPTAWLSPSYVLVSHVPLLPHRCLPSTCSESSSPTPSVSPLPCSLSN